MKKRCQGALLLAIAALTGMLAAAGALDPDRRNRAHAALFDARLNDTSHWLMLDNPTEFAKQAARGDQVERFGPGRRRPAEHVSRHRS